MPSSVEVEHVSSSNTTLDSDNRRLSIIEKIQSYWLRKQVENCCVDIKYFNYLDFRTLDELMDNYDFVFDEEQTSQINVITGEERKSKQPRALRQMLLTTDAGSWLASGEYEAILKLGLERKDVNSNGDERFPLVFGTYGYLIDYDGDVPVFSYVTKLYPCNLRQAVEEKIEFANHDISIMMQRLIGAVKEMSDQGFHHGNILPDNILLTNKYDLTHCVLSEISVLYSTHKEKDRIYSLLPRTTRRAYLSLPACWLIQTWINVVRVYDEGRNYEGHGMRTYFDIEEESTARFEGTQRLSNKLDAVKVDYNSLGCILYYVLAGEDLIDAQPCERHHPNDADCSDLFWCSECNKMLIGQMLPATDEPRLKLVKNMERELNMGEAGDLIRLLLTSDQSPDQLSKHPFLLKYKVPLKTPLPQSVFIDDDASNSSFFDDNDESDTARDNLQLIYEEFHRTSTHPPSISKPPSKPKHSSTTGQWSTFSNRQKQSSNVRDSDFIEGEIEISYQDRSSTNDQEEPQTDWNEVLKFSTQYPTKNGAQSTSNQSRKSGLNESSTGSQGQNMNSGKIVNKIWCYWWKQQVESCSEDLSSFDGIDFLSLEDLKLMYNFPRSEQDSRQSIVQGYKKDGRELRSLFEFRSQGPFAFELAVGEFKAMKILNMVKADEDEQDPESTLFMPQYGTYSYNLNGDIVYAFVTKYYPTNLREAVSSNETGTERFQVHEVKYMMKRLFDAVIYMNMRGIQHGNITSDNILLKDPQSLYHCVLTGLNAVNTIPAENGSKLNNYISYLPTVTRRAYQCLEICQLIDSWINFAQDKGPEISDDEILEGTESDTTLDVKHVDGFGLACCMWLAMEGTDFIDDTPCPKHTSYDHDDVNVKWCKDCNQMLINQLSNKQAMSDKCWTECGRYLLQTPDRKEQELAENVLNSLMVLNAPLNLFRQFPFFRNIPEAPQMPPDLIEMESEPENEPCGSLRISQQSGTRDKSGSPGVKEQSYKHKSASPSRVSHTTTRDHVPSGSRGSTTRKRPSAHGDKPLSESTRADMTFDQLESVRVSRMSSRRTPTPSNLTFDEGRRTPSCEDRKPKSNSQSRTGSLSSSKIKNKELHHGSTGEENRGDGSPSTKEVKSIERSPIPDVIKVSLPKSDYRSRKQKEADKRKSAEPEVRKNIALQKEVIMAGCLSATTGLVVTRAGPTTTFQNLQNDAATLTEVELSLLHRNGMPLKACVNYSNASTCKQ